jgi:hypothetical protein
MVHVGPNVLLIVIAGEWAMDSFATHKKVSVSESVLEIMIVISTAGSIIAICLQVST